jgi:hypothetical protein
MTFAEWAQNNEVSFSNVWFSDEAHFHLDGVVKKQNVWFWASRESMCDSWEENYIVWDIISSHGLLEPIFF